MQRVTGLKTHHFTKTLGAGNTLAGIPLDEDATVKVRRLGQVWLRLASQIVEWDVGVAPDTLEALLSSSCYGRIRSVKISSFGRRILEQSPSPIVETLERCSALSSLTITQKALLLPANANLPQIHPDNLLRPFPFRQTLRSLTLDTHGQRTTIEPNHLHFAALFPLLEHLKLPTDAINAEFVDFPEEPHTLCLPRLLHLEIEFSHLFFSGHSSVGYGLVYPDLDLPLLVRLDLNEGPDCDQSEDRLELSQQLNDFRDMSDDLHHYSKTLQVINVRIGRAPIFSTLIRRLKQRVCQNVNIDWMYGSFEAHTDLVGEEPDLEDVEELNEERARQQKLIDKIDPLVYHQLRLGFLDVTSWLFQYDFMYHPDPVALQQLLRLLEPVCQLRKWLED